MSEKYLVPDDLDEVGAALHKAGVHDWFTVNDEDNVDSVEVWACNESDTAIRREAAEAGYRLEPLEVLVNIRYRVYKIHN